MRILALLLVFSIIASAQPTPDKPATLAGVLEQSFRNGGLPAAENIFTQLQAEKFGKLALDESELNNLAYTLLNEQRLPEGLAVLKWNTELFPESGNTFDSYAEGLWRAGNREATLANYQKSLALDPANKNAVAMLSQLGAGPEAFTLGQERLLLNDALGAADNDLTALKQVDLTPLRARVRALVERDPSDANASLVNNFLYVSEAADLTEAVADWEYFAGSSNDKIRTLGAGKRGLAEALKTPLELKFTAADGRPVDLAQLRGKVVLVDFWATWCGPCRAEIPNVVATYEKFHDKGFEIVGISFDKAPDTSKPWKSARSAEQVLAFAKEHKMPWPQFYEGSYWDNSLGKRFGIRAIPAMFLVDKRGLIVSTNARGAKLEREVRRLLSE